MYWSNLTGVPQALTLAHQTTAENMQWIDQRIATCVPAFSGKAWLGEPSAVEHLTIPGNYGFQLARSCNVVCEIALFMARGASGYRLYVGNGIAPDADMQAALAAINAQIIRLWPKLSTPRTAAPALGAGLLTDARASLVIAINTFERPMTVIVPPGVSRFTTLNGSTTTTGPAMPGAAFTITASTVLFWE